MTSPFGQAGSLVLLVFWVYYASLIVLFGAELTRVYTRRVSATVRSLATYQPSAVIWCFAR